MELANIEQLLEKYENAETTIAEESKLRAFFQTEEVPTHLEDYKSLFGYFSQNKNEQYTKSIQLKTEKKYWKWLSVAASLVFLISMYSYVNYQNKLKQDRILAEKTFIQTQEAFQLLASNLNKGNDAVLQLASNLNKGNDAMSQLATFNTATKKVFKTKK